MNWLPTTQPLTVKQAAIPGLFLFDLDVRGDNRGWFKENFQRQKILDTLGEMDHTEALKNFIVVQNNISFNKQRGVARGIHAEPWDKYISLAQGEAFAAIVDLREGSTYGRAETFHLTPNNAIFVPRGCGNSFQALTDDLVYTYLVNEHWSPDATYSFVNLRDPDLHIAWPIPLDDALLSDKDKNHPLLKDTKPFKI